MSSLQFCFRVIGCLSLFALFSAAVLAADSPSQVFVVNTADGSVSLVDLTKMAEIKQFKVGQRPYGIAVTRDGQKVAVGIEDEECVKFFSLPAFNLLAKVPIGKMFNDHIILSADGKEMLVAGCVNGHGRSELGLEAHVGQGSEVGAGGGELDVACVDALPVPEPEADGRCDIFSVKKLDGGRGER